MNYLDRMYLWLANDSASVFEGGHSIFTSRKLVEKAVADININDTFLVMLNIEFVLGLLERGVNKDNIVFLGDHKNKEKIVKRLNIKYIKQLEADMIFDGVFVNPPFKHCKEFRNLGVTHATKFVWMITKTDHMDNVSHFSDVTYYKHLGGNAFKEQILTCSFLIDKHKKAGDLITIENSTGETVTVPEVKIPPAENLSNWKFASNVVSLRLTTYKAGGGYIGQSKAIKAIGTDGIKCIWRCGPVGGEFEWDLIDRCHTDRVTGVGEHKIIVSKMTSIGNLGDVKYAGPEFGVGDTCYRVALTSKEECLAAIEYLNSPPVRKLLKGIKTMTASSSNKIWSKIPHHSEKDKWISM
jgi:hypothetical protein